MRAAWEKQNGLPGGREGCAVGAPQAARAPVAKGAAAVAIVEARRQDDFETLAQAGRPSGLLQEVRKRRFSGRGKTKRARKLSAIYRASKKEDMAKAKKLGLA